MEFRTERLILRPWEEGDAESLYEYAKNPEVGPIAGWPVHTSVKDSLSIIRNVLSAPETYTVCLKEDNRPIGSVGLIMPMQSHTRVGEDEIEIGYWIGVDFWGNGYIPEAVRRMQRHVFEDLGCSAMWCGYYDGNSKSKRCQEKCGFVFHHTEADKHSHRRSYLLISSLLRIQYTHHHGRTLRHPAGGLPGHIYRYLRHCRPEKGKGGN